MFAHRCPAEVRLLFFLQAFFDESHDEQSERVHGMGGIMAPEEYWRGVWQAWDAVLDKHHLSYMHWADCVWGHGIFKRLDDPVREEIQRDCLRVIVETDPNLFVANASVIAMEAYAKFLPRLKVIRKIPPGGPINGTLCDEYFLGFQHSVQQMALHPGVPELPVEETIAFIFDQTEFAPRAYSLFMTLKTMPRLPYAARLGSCSFDEMKKAKPLQMADALAYEYVRFANDTVINRRPERWQHRMLQERFGPGWYFREADIQEFVTNLEEA